MDWPVRFLEAIPVGVNVAPVLWKQNIWRLKKLLDFLQKKDQIEPALKECIDYCDAELHKTATRKDRLATITAAKSIANWQIRQAALYSVIGVRTVVDSSALSAWDVIQALEDINKRPLAWIDEAEHLLMLLRQAQ